MKMALTALLTRVKETKFTKFFLILLVFNVIFASNYLFSSSDKMPGFPYRQDAYGYMLEADHLIRLSTENFAFPTIISWFDQIYCGFQHVFTDLPLHLIYTPTLFLTSDLIFAYKATLFMLYLFATLSMYYLTYLITKNHIHCLVSATVYVFSQILAFEVFLGHLSMVLGYALIPLIVATYLKALWDRSIFHGTLAGGLFSVLLIVRPDFGYFTSIFVILLALYFVLTQPKGQRSHIFKHTTILFIIAFSLSYPFLSERYISSAKLIATRFEQSEYDYRFYSPRLWQYLLPYSIDTNAYLGISVVLLSVIGLLSCLNNSPKEEILKNCRMRVNRFSVFLSIIFLIFFILSSGSNIDPIYSFFCRYVPFFDVLRVPTRWLVIAQLCLAILAGKGAFFLVNRISNKGTKRVLFTKKNVKKIMTISLACIILLDYSIYFGKAKKFHFTVHYNNVKEWQSYSFVFPPALSTPEKSEVYENLTSMDGGLYRILVVPNIYTVPYFYYMENLQGSNVTFAYGYGYHQRVFLQREVYQSFAKFLGNETLGEKMSLLGIKYIMFQPDRLNLTCNTLFEKLNDSCSCLEYVTNDESFALYENKHESFALYGNKGVFAVKKLTDSLDHLLSPGNQANASVRYWAEDSMSRTLEVNTFSHNCYIVMSQSYDDGWHVYSQNKDVELKIEEYKGLSYINFTSLKPGKYILSIKFTKYWSSLSFCTYFYSCVVTLIVALNLVLSRSFTRRYFDSNKKSRK